MIVSNNTIEAEGVGDFFRNLGRKGLNVSKNLRKNVLSNPTQVLDITANIATAAASRNPEKVIVRCEQFLSHREKFLPWKFCLI